MKYAPLVTSAAGIALLLASAAPALAEDSNSGTSASVESSTTIHVETEDSGDSDSHHGLLDGLKARFTASSTEREDRKASSTEHRVQKVEGKAENMIDQRIKSLQDLLKRLEGMKLLPADTLVTIQTAINAEIQTLIDLKAKIATDTATTTIKADAQSITKANRVYLLVEPKARIAAAASRVNAVVTQMQALSVKLQARLTAAQTAGADITASSAALTDFNAKIADAKVQADAAVTETANLQVDNGDKTILAANLAALKDARAKLDAAQKDLVAARQDAAKIYGVVKGKEGKGQGVEHSNSTTTETH